MTDLIVKLYDLPAPSTARTLEAVNIRRGMAYEKHLIVAWVATHFGPAWASECDVAFSNSPISCHVATLDGELIGFACYDSACRGFFGPIGVAQTHRGKGAGRELLMSCMFQMKSLGYGYVIIGGAGAQAFYASSVGAIPILGSAPGIYTNRLKAPAESGKSPDAFPEPNPRD